MDSFASFSFSLAELSVEEMTLSSTSDMAAQCGEPILVDADRPSNDYGSFCTIA